jgi:ribonuclease E
MPAPPAHEIAAAPEADEPPIVEPMAEVETQRGEEQSHDEQRSAAPGEQGGEPGGRKRRRRGRRGGRRRRRGEPGQDLAPGEQPAELSGDATPIAEAVEYVPAASGQDDAAEEAAEEMAEALHASPAPAAGIEGGVESVPVAERGDHAAEPAAPSTAGAAAADVAAHEATGGSPANPKRGWWRRVLDS